jgi:hypothetical protein
MEPQATNTYRGDIIYTRKSVLKYRNSNQKTPKETEFKQVSIIVPEKSENDDKEEIKRGLERNEQQDWVRMRTHVDRPEQIPQEDVR